MKIIIARFVWSCERGIAKTRYYQAPVRAEQEPGCK
jgi:hypothetical protein